MIGGAIIQMIRGAIIQMSELDQICPCSSACDPKNYEGRPMLFPDEAWHNWFLNKLEGTLEEDEYIDMYGNDE